LIIRRRVFIAGFAEVLTPLKILLIYKKIKNNP